MLHRVFEPFVQASQGLQPDRGGLGLGLALEISGHEVRLAHDGPQGLDLARAWHAEAVLSDIGLPGRDGDQVARAFRLDPELCDSFLVALTGYAQPEDLQRASAAGFNRHLARPPQLADLEELLAGLPASG
jgi:CheY-like chemotaxis protein